MNDIKAKNLFGLIFWFHLLLELVSISSPFLFSWYIVLGIIVLSIQYLVIGGCILNKLQFGEARNITFAYPYLRLMGLAVKPEKVKFFMRVNLPAIVLGIALVWQVVLGENPWII